MKGILLAVALMAGGAPLASAQVYKCKGASGETVYSQNPCAAGAEPMKLRSTRPSTESAGEASNRAAVYQNTALADAGIAERNCVQGERSRIYGPLESRSQQMGRQIAELNLQLATAGTQLAGATQDSGIRAQISSLQQSMSAERVAAIPRCRTHASSALRPAASGSARCATRSATRPRPRADPPATPEPAPASAPGSCARRVHPRPGSGGTDKSAVSSGRHRCAGCLHG